MDHRKIADLVSLASWEEPTLLFHSPGEVEKDLAEGRAVVIEEGGELVGFCGWRDLGDWLELRTVYVAPKFRGQGYAFHLFSEAQRRLELLLPKRKIFLFTQVPVMKKIISEWYNFKPANYSVLPWGVWLKIVAHRMHPRRIVSYVKYLKGLHRLGAWQLFIFERRD